MPRKAGKGGKAGVGRPPGGVEAGRVTKGAAGGKGGKRGPGRPPSRGRLSSSSPASKDRRLAKSLSPRQESIAPNVFVNEFLATHKRRQGLEAELQLVENQILDLEGKYFDTFNRVGNAVKGYSGFLKATAANAEQLGAENLELDFTAGDRRIFIYFEKK